MLVVFLRYCDHSLWVPWGTWFWCVLMTHHDTIWHQSSRRLRLPATFGSFPLTPASCWTSPKSSACTISLGCQDFLRWKPPWLKMWLFKYIFVCKDLCKNITYIYNTHILRLFFPIDRGRWLAFVANISCPWHSIIISHDKSQWWLFHWLTCPLCWFPQVPRVWPPCLRRLKHSSLINMLYFHLAVENGPISFDDSCTALKWWFSTAKLNYPG